VFWHSALNEQRDSGDPAHSLISGRSFENEFRSKAFAHKIKSHPTRMGLFALMPMSWAKGQVFLTFSLYSFCIANGKLARNRFKERFTSQLVATTTEAKHNYRRRKPAHLQSDQMPDYTSNRNCI